MWLFGKCGEKVVIGECGVQMPVGICNDICDVILYGVPEVSNPARNRTASASLTHPACHDRSGTSSMSPASVSDAAA